MQLPTILLAFLVAAVAAFRNDHPVASVIKLLKELQFKVEDEGTAETATFGKFKEWCDDSKYTLDKAVKSDMESIDTLTDKVSAKTIEEKSIKEHIKFLEEEILSSESDDSSAKTDREAANALYKTADGDYDTTIAAVGEALTALKDSKKAALLQFMKPENPRQENALRKLVQQPLVLALLSDQQRDQLSAAVFGGEEPKVTEEDIMAKKKYAATGATYTFKSGTVIELLESLETHFKDAKITATKEETAAENEYQVGKDARKEAIATAKTTKSAKETELGQVQGDLNTAKSSLSDEESELKSDKQTLDDTKQTCDLKASQFKERMNLRRQEIAAMKEAVMILGEVSGVRTKAPENKQLPTPPTDKALLLQIAKAVDPKMKAVNLIRQQATESHNKQLSRFADQLAAHLGGHFDEINGMVQKMIFRLMAEQNDEDKHKAWCDLEVATSEKSEETKSAKVKSLGTEIDDAKATVAELELKVTALNKKVAALTVYMAEATEVRAEGKKENMATIKDSEEAQTAIAKATAVLESYYKETGMIQKEPWEFLQEPSPVKLPEEPESWGSSYTGVTDPSAQPGGVVAVLKAAAAKFASVEGETRAQEVSDQTDFDKTMKAEAINKAGAAQEATMKEDEKKRTTDKVNALTRKMKAVNNELGAVKQYLKDLKPACIDGDSTYEDRKAARDKEITALKEAQVILQEAFAEKSLLQTIQKHA